MFHEYVKLLINNSRKISNESLAFAENGKKLSKGFPSEYKGLKVKVGFGKGNWAKVTWIGFLAGGQSIQKGIYPVYLYYRDIDVLILAYGVSETKVPDLKWPILDADTIQKYFKENRWVPWRYKKSLVYKPYTSDALKNITDAFDKDLDNLLYRYKEIMNNSATISTNMGGGIEPESHAPLQIIYFGAPGTGKSYKVKHDVIPAGAKYHTVTFYSDYYYSDFVGGIRPERTQAGIAYTFQPGPFAKALKDSFTEPVYLVIEEINRGNAAAIFGDIFQLLDRKDGNSDYTITNHELYEYLIKEGVKGLNEKDKIYLPSNLNIVCTMNTADQNVFVLDTAFKRRFKMEYVPIDFNAYYEDGSLKTNCAGYVEKCDIFTDDSYEKELEKIIPANIYARVKETVKIVERNWPTFAAYVNAKIDEINSAEHKISEDKKLGPFFIDIEELEDIKGFVDKVIYYLKQDVFKYEDNILDESYETLYDKFVNKKHDLFRIFEPML